ncbi:DNA mismatch repair protein, MSH2, partial [Cynara cardunculus var. scolymus]
MDGDLQEYNKLPELKLDAKQAQGFLTFFKKLPNDTKAVRFFDRRDYFTAHGENASFIAKTYYHTTTALRQIGSGSDAVSSVSVSKNMFETIVRDLLLERTDHSLELYEGSGSNWRLMKRGTPGNLGSFEDVLFANNDMQDSPVIVALVPNFRETGCTVGLGYVDLAKRVLGMAEFLDDSHFTSAESALVALGCKECLLPTELTKSSECKALYDAISRCGAMVTERKKAEFKGRDLAQDLGRLVKGSSEPVRDLASAFEFAPGALGVLLSYAELLADENNYGNYTISQYNLNSYMRLDSAAIRALNVMESKTDANKNFSLFGLMNRTCTAGMGRRLLHMWLKQPLLDVTEINVRLDLVQTFVEDPAFRQDLRQHLKRISDIERLMRSIEKRRASLFHIVKLYQSSIRLPFIKSAMERYDGQFASLVKGRYTDHLNYWTNDDHLNKFIGLVEVAVDLDQLENGEYMISPGYDSQLSTLKNEQESVEQQIHDLHEQTAKDLDLPLDKGLKLDKGTQFGHVFRITKKEEPKVRQKLNTLFIVLETRKDGVKFTNTKLKKLGDQYQKILEEYKNCQKELVARVVETAATFSEMVIDESSIQVFEGLAMLLSELDVLLSFADLAASSPTPYARPEITKSDTGDIILEGSRHPCVEAQDWVNFIPNDCKLVRGKSWFQIITGPNMGGKSTFIRQVGVNILMAQVGSFVPCDKASISIRDCIFARVGAGDCQLRGISTFMQEMLETASILKGATDKSLIIIDELGRGTSTYDGFGLAWAICEHLVEVIKAPTLFATHFHELTALAHENAGKPSGVANYHVSAHIDSSSQKLTMLYKNCGNPLIMADFVFIFCDTDYKVEPGACDQSFGIHVAEFANFPESVKPSEPDDMALGAPRARQFLKDFSELPLDKMDLKQALQEVKRLKNELQDDASN